MKYTLALNLQYQFRRRHILHNFLDVFGILGFTSCKSRFPKLRNPPLQLQISSNSSTIKYGYNGGLIEIKLVAALARYITRFTQ